MYEIVYPENGELVVPIQFVFQTDASKYWMLSHTAGQWAEIPPQCPDDVFAFMNCLTGEIVVVRRKNEQISSV